jgi:hypothetical protein
MGASDVKRLTRLLARTILMAVAASSCAQTSRPAAPDNDAPASHNLQNTTATPPQQDPLTQEQIKDLIRKVAENDIANDKKLRDYTYIEREETKKLNKQGEVTSTESKTSEVLQISGETVEKLIAKNDKPLSEKEAEKEDARIQKIIDKRRNESDSDREKRIQKEERQREEGREFVKEIADAYNFRLLGAEPIDGRDTWVIEAVPRPGYEPHKKEAKALTRIAGKIWIDKSEDQWVRMDVHVIDTISFGLFLARLHEGTRVVVEQTRVNEEVWLPKHAAVHVDVRVALLKNFDVDLDVTDRDYKKFRTGSRIVGMKELDPSDPRQTEPPKPDPPASDPPAQRRAPEND